MSANLTTQLDDARRALLTEATAADLAAARVALGRATAWATQTQQQLATLDDAALSAAHDWARDLRHVAERLTVNLP